MKKILLLAALAAGQPTNQLSPVILKGLVEHSQPAQRAIMIDNLDRARQTSPDLDELIRLLNLDAATDGLKYTPLWNQVRIYKPEEQGVRLKSFFTFYYKAARSIRLDKAPEMLTDDLVIAWMKDCPEFKNTFVEMIKILIKKQQQNQMSILPFLNELFASSYGLKLTEEQMQDLMEQTFHPIGNSEPDEETKQLQQAVQIGIQRGLQEAGSTHK